MIYLCNLIRLTHLSHIWTHSMMTIHISHYSHFTAYRAIFSYPIITPTSYAILTPICLIDCHEQGIHLSYPSLDLDLRNIIYLHFIDIASRDQVSHPHQRHPFILANLATWVDAMHRQSSGAGGS